MRNPWVVGCVVQQGTTVALTQTRLQLPHVDLGAVVLGVLEDTSDSALEDAKDTVAPLVPAAVNVVDDGLLLDDEYPDEEEASTTPLASP